jgi:hypothetical protein
VRAENELWNLECDRRRKIRKRSRNLSNQGVAAVRRRKGEKKRRGRRCDGKKDATYMYLRITA